MHWACVYSFTGAVIESEVFRKYYVQLVSILPANDLLHQLVATQVINMADVEEIASISTSREKASYLLRIVARSLEAGITTSFYALLDIMENYGNFVTAQAANDIKKMLIEQSGVYFVCNLSDLHVIL